MKCKLEGEFEFLPRDRVRNVQLTSALGEFSAGIKIFISIKSTVIQSAMTVQELGIEPQSLT
jgi:hypothetical protein